MSYQPLIPLATDKKSKSQADIKENFTLLEDTYNGINEKLVLKEQAASPATAANQMALYTKDVAGITAMFIRPEGSGTEVDFTTAVKANNGWCKLPCGIIFLWFLVPSVTNSTTYNFSTYMTVPIITNVHYAQVSAKWTGVDLSYPVEYSILTTSSIVLQTKNVSGHSAASVFVVAS